MASGSRPPHAVHLVGRPAGRDNSILCGQYTLFGSYNNMPVYRLRGKKTVIKYSLQSRRWLIDVHGMRESDVCSAFACNKTLGASHPGFTELEWKVWESSQQLHVLDPEMASISADSAPLIVSMLGLSPQREYGPALGEYQLVSVHHGRPAYQQKLGGQFVLKYYHPSSRWLLACAEHTGNLCCAYAEGPMALHPGLPSLQWHCHDAGRNKFVSAPPVKVLPCPSFVHLIGRNATAECIIGTYNLSGMFDERPLYVARESKNVIRYAAKTRRWLVQCGGIELPGIMSKVYQWLRTGDSSVAEAPCEAFADAGNTEHPACCNLVWHVHDAPSGKFLPDAVIRATTAPLAVVVGGREVGRENVELNGRYSLCATRCGRPAYNKQGSKMVIRYWEPMARWVIDAEGLRDSDCCIAYCDGAGFDDPVDLRAWHVFSAARGAFTKDPNVACVVAQDAPLFLPGLPRKRVIEDQQAGAFKRRALFAPGGA